MKTVNLTRAPFHEARIVMVDDEPSNLRLLEGILRDEGYANLHSITNPRHLFRHFIDGEPDLILLDLMMPEINGFEIMERLSTICSPGTCPPILILTADATPETKRKALASEASDFLTKPFDYTEVVLRIRNLLTTRFYSLELRSHNRRLEETVRARTESLAQAQAEILTRLAHAAEFRDDDTGRHTQRVSHTSALLAREMKLPDDMVELIRQAAPLHDVGKIGVSDLILLKPGRLTNEEFDVIKTHPQIGGALLSEGRSPLVQMAERIARSHHERWDGCGYPQRLAQEEIPIEGRIVAVADVFDALVHERPYKKAWPVEDAVAEIQRQGGTQFDPAATEAFVKLPHESLLL
jgi:putative two-component system response regulator